MKNSLLIAVTCLLSVGASYGMKSTTATARTTPAAARVVAQPVAARAAAVRTATLTPQQRLDRGVARWGAVVTALNREGYAQSNPAIMGWATSNQQRAQRRLTRFQSGAYTGGRRSATSRRTARAAAIGRSKSGRQRTTTSRATMSRRGARTTATRTTRRGTQPARRGLFGRSRRVAA